MPKQSFLSPKESRIPFGLKFRVLMTLTWLGIIAVSAVIFSGSWFHDEDAFDEAEFYRTLNHITDMEQSEQLVPAHWD